MTFECNICLNRDKRLILLLNAHACKSWNVYQIHSRGIFDDKDVILLQYSKYVFNFWKRKCELFGIYWLVLIVRQFW